MSGAVDARLDPVELASKVIADWFGHDDEDAYAQPFDICLARAATVAALRRIEQYAEEYDSVKTAMFCRAEIARLEAEDA